MRPMRPVLGCIAVLTLSACDPAMPPDMSDTALPVTTLPLFGDGYRGAEDTCQRVGENAQTNTFLDDAADLVGCPSGTPDAASFAAETGGIEVAEIEGYTLFSVPRR